MNSRRLATVVSNKKYTEGTLVVSVKNERKHPKYHKTIRKETRYQVQHDDKTLVELGTKVYITQCAPVSKYKNWKIVEVSC